MMTKKGIIQINQIVPIIVILVIAAFVAGISMLASNEFSDTLDESLDQGNATLSAVATNTNYSLGHRNIQISSFHIVNITGTSTGSDVAHVQEDLERSTDCTDGTSQTQPVLRCGNYTLYTEIGLIEFNSTNDGTDHGVKAYNFSYTSSGSAGASVNNTVSGMFNLTTQLPLFGTIVGLFIILGVIFLLVRNKIQIG